MSTRIFGSRLETRPLNREAATVRSAPLTERFAEEEQHERFLALWKDGKKPDCYYEFTRSERRAAIADERQRKLIQAGLADGQITLARYMDYRLWQIETDIKHVPGQPSIDDVSFTRFATESAQGLEASALARCTPTIAVVDNAVRQIHEMVAAAHLHAAVIEQRIG